MYIIRFGVGSDKDDGPRTPIVIMQPRFLKTSCWTLKTKMVKNYSLSSLSYDANMETIGHKNHQSTF